MKIKASLFALIVFLNIHVKSQLTFRGDYETGITGSNTWSSLQTVATNRYTQDTHYVRQGNYAARVEVRSGDFIGNPSSERAEVMKNLGEIEGSESWYGFSVYFPNDFNPDTTSAYPFWNIFTQWHHSGSAGQANIMFEVNTAGSPWSIEIRSFGGTLDQNKKTFKLASLQRNIWFDFIFHVRWASDNTGYYEIWLNCQKVLQKTYTPTIYSGEYVYAKQGFYRAASSLTSVLYLDGFIRATDSTSVFNEFCKLVGIGKMDDKSNERLIVFPNPFSNKIFVNNLKGNEIFELSNSSGQSIWKGEDIEKADFSNLTNGLYFLKIITQHSIETTKIIKR